MTSTGVAAPVQLTKQSPPATAVMSDVRQCDLMMNHMIQKMITFCCVLTIGCMNEVKPTPSFSLSIPAPVDWDMSPTDAVNVATQYAADNDISLAAYDEPRVTADVFEGERFWAVLYEGKTRMPGNHFMLLINDETRAIEYVPGE